MGSGLVEGLGVLGTTEANGGMQQQVSKASARTNVHCVLIGHSLGGICAALQALSAEKVCVCVFVCAFVCVCLCVCVCVCVPMVAEETQWSIGI
jgi:hypothetical protein